MCSGCESHFRQRWVTCVILVHISWILCFAGLLFPLWCWISRCQGLTFAHHKQRRKTFFQALQDRNEHSRRDVRCAFLIVLWPISFQRRNVKWSFLSCPGLRGERNRTGKPAGDVEKYVKSDRLQQNLVQLPSSLCLHKEKIITVCSGNLPSRFRYTIPVFVIVGTLSLGKLRQVMHA